MDGQLVPCGDREIINVFKTHQKLTEVPLTDEQTQLMLSAAVKEVRRTVMARRLMSLFGPLGAGVESVSMETISQEDTAAEVHLEGMPDPHPITMHAQEEYVRIPIIYKDFLLHWRDVKFANDMGSPLDVSNAVRAAHQVGHAEDHLLFNGNKELGIVGLLSSKDSHSLVSEDWSKDGACVKAVYAAMDKLLGSNHHFPYALVVSLDMYRMLLKPVQDRPVLELEQVTKVLSDGVFWSPQVPEGTAALVSTGSQNFDIAVAEDLQIAYLGPREMNYHFRVYQSLVPRIKRPTAVCIIKQK